MIEPDIMYPFITREIFAWERYIFARGRSVFPQSMFIQPENPQLPIPQSEEEEDD